MLIYFFVEHYPTPYKPYFDTQFTHLIREGHMIRIFASGKYVSTINKEINLYELDKKTRYYPTTLKTLPRLALPILLRFLRHPFTHVRHALGIFANAKSFKQGFLIMARMLLLPHKEPDVCFIHNLAVATKFTFLAMHYPNARIVMYFHGGEIARTPRVQDGKMAFKKMHLVFTNTEFSQQQAIQCGCEARKIEIGPVGFHISDYPDDSMKQYRRDGILRLISVGRLGEEKGYIYALEAIKDLLAKGVSQFTYTIVGYGYLLATLKDFVNKNGLTKHVIFAGEKSKDDVIAELKLSDVLILPSITTDTWSETQACVVQEAMLMRLLVVTTNTGGVPESISDEMRRFSVEPRDAKGIADKILEIMSLTDTEMQELGDAGRRFVVRDYDIVSVTDRILKQIQEKT